MDAPEWVAIRCAGKAWRRRALRFAWAGRSGPFARKEEQRRQRAEVRLNRVCSALNRVVKAVVGKNPIKVKMLHAVESGQLRFLGLSVDVDFERLGIQAPDCPGLALHLLL